MVVKLKRRVRKGKRKHARARGRRKNKPQQSLIVHPSKGLVFPSRMFIKMKCKTFGSFIPGGSPTGYPYYNGGYQGLQTLVNTNQFQVFMNMIDAPLSTTANVVGYYGAQYGVSTYGTAPSCWTFALGTSSSNLSQQDLPVGSTGAYLQPQGHGSIFNTTSTAIQYGQLYNNYVVHAAAIKFEINEATQGDSLAVVLTPILYQNAAGVGFATRYEANGAPLSKAMFMNSTSGKNVLKHYCKLRTLDGSTKAEYDASCRTRYGLSIVNNASGQTSVTAPMKAAYWNILLYAADGNASGQSIAFNVELTYWVEYFGIATSAMRYLQTQA